MTNVAVVYHSGYGHTAAVAEHVGKGPEVVAGTSAKLYKAEELSSPDSGPWAELAIADAIIFGAPTYMGSASAGMKQFMDASSKVWFTQGWKNKIESRLFEFGKLVGRQAFNALAIRRVRGSARHDLGRHRNDARLQYEWRIAGQHQSHRIVFRLDDTGEHRRRSGSRAATG